jgi:hypothetical protein
MKTNDARSTMVSEAKFDASALPALHMQQPKLQQPKSLSKTDSSRRELA